MAVGGAEVGVGAACVGVGAGTVAVGVLADGCVAVSVGTEGSDVGVDVPDAPPPAGVSDGVGLGPGEGESAVAVAVFTAGAPPAAKPAAAEAPAPPAIVTEALSLHDGEQMALLDEIVAVFELPQAPAPTIWALNVNTFAAPSARSPRVISTCRCRSMVPPVTSLRWPTRSTP